MSTAADVGLTSRESEVLEHIRAGADNLQIAALLGITERTVKAHVNALYRKLGVENRVEVALHGRRDPRRAVASHASAGDPPKDLRALQRTLLAQAELRATLRAHVQAGWDQLAELRRTKHDHESARTKLQRLLETPAAQKD